MLKILTDNMSRQSKALLRLEELLQEEYSYLGALDPKAVMAIEFSIQELIRQIGQERIEFKRLFTEIAPGKRLEEVVDGFPEPHVFNLRELMREINQVESVCSEMAGRNYKLALGLFDQSKGYVDFIQKNIMPKSEIYSARGRYGKTPSVQGALLSGRL